MTAPMQRKVMAVATALALIDGTAAQCSVKDVRRELHKVRRMWKFGAFPWAEIPSEATVTRTAAKYLEGVVDAGVWDVRKGMKHYRRMCAESNARL